MLARTQAVKILVVDDEPLLARSMGRMLKTGGYECALASDGLEAWSLFESEPDAWDLLITDIRMPGLDGVNLAQRVRDAGSAIPVVFVSGHGEVPNLGPLTPAAFLAKPFRRTQLLAAVASSAFADA